MAYKQVDERFWKDRKIKQLSKDGCLLFLYLLTSPHTHFSGLSEMSLEYISIDTPLSNTESANAFIELAALGLVEHDPENEIVWIKNMYKYQIKSEKQLKGAQRQIESLPRCLLCKSLAEILKIPYAYPIDRVSEVENTLSGVENTLSIQEEAKAKAKAKAKVKKKSAPEKPDLNFESLIPVELLHADFIKSWSDFLVFRKEMRKPVTRIAAERLLSKLQLWGTTKAVQALELSITNGWQGVFEPKAEARASEGPIWVPEF